MPELPDVECFKQYLDSTALHQKIEEVDVSNTKILGKVSARVLQRRLKGRSLESSRRHGKYLFAEVGREGWLVLHFGMTGYLEYSQNEDPPKHTRLLLEFDNGFHLAYVCMRMLGKVDWTDDAEQFIEGHELGVDGLSDQLDFAEFRGRLHSKRTSIKSALMDQQTVAGLGNVYVDEMLFQARVHPKTRTTDLDEKAWKAVHRQIRRVLEKAIQARAQPEDMPKSFLIPRRGRKDAKCPRCGTGLESTKVSGRTTYFCPRCQQK